jgi:hypothetical protein
MSPIYGISHRSETPLAEPAKLVLDTTTQRVVAVLEQR